MIHPDSRIYPQAKIVGDSSRFSLGAHSQIDDFVFLYIGEGCHIGRNVHLASFCSIIGGGLCHFGDFSGLSAGCRIITGSDDFTGPWMTNPTVPPAYTHVTRAPVSLGKHAVLGTNCIVFPGVTIGEGAAVAAGSIIRKDLEPWGVYAGSGSLKRIAERDRDAILALEARYLDAESSSSSPS